MGIYHFLAATLGSSWRETSLSYPIAKPEYWDKVDRKRYDAYLLDANAPW